MSTHFTGYLGKKKRSKDEHFMNIALTMAEEAKSRGDSARGAVLVFPSSHIAEGHTVFTEHDPLAHAEINVLRKACQTLHKSFKDAILYCTVEPCAMCAIAATEHGVREIIFGAYDDSNGFLSSPRGIVAEKFDLTFIGGVLSEACYNITTPSLREHLRYKTEGEYVE
jgi:tRNA(adenine34) deaminase